MSFVMQEVIEDMENIIVNWNWLSCILSSQTKMRERAAGKRIISASSNTNISINWSRKFWFELGRSWRHIEAHSYPQWSISSLFEMLNPFVWVFFQAVLETIRDLMNTECLVPDWIHDIFLGYDDPAAAHYTRWTGFILF